MFPLRDPTVGKTSASEVEFTPALYLQSFQILKKAKANGTRPTHGLNENQLNAQFRLWLQENKGLMGRGAKVDTPTLMKMAVTFLKAEAAEAKPGQNKKKPEHPHKKLFAENGLDLDLIAPEAEMQELAADDEFDPIDLMTPTEVAYELVKVAQGASPGMAVAALFVAHELADVSDKAAETLVEKYEARAQTKDEKEICVLGMDEMMQEPDRQQVGEKLEVLAQNESDPEMAARLLELKENKQKETVPLTELFRDTGVTFSRGLVSPAVRAKMPSICLN
mgnify:CR=1 FL=1